MERQNVPIFTNEFTKSTRIIHTASAFAKSNLPFVQEIGSLSSLAPHVSSRRELRSYLFFIVTKGEGCLTYEDRSYILREGDCAFIDCRRSYSQSSSDHKGDGGYDRLWSLSWIHFCGPNMDAVYDKYLERGGQPVFHAASPDEYIRTHNRLFEIASGDSYVRDMEMAAGLTMLLARLMEDAWSLENSLHSAGPKQISPAKVKTYIEGHYKERLSLEILAEHFFINKNYLAGLFKETYGFTVNGYIAHVRISKAKALLRFSDMSIERIGAEVGIDDANYFARTFKKIEGMSPRAYRRSW